MNEFYLLGAAFVILAGALSVMCVLLKRELVPVLVECWSDLLDNAASSIR